MRNHNRMIEVVCEGRHFGDRTNENARDWLWVVLVAWAAKSVSLFAGQDLGSDSTFLPHGTDHGDLRRAHNVFESIIWNLKHTACTPHIPCAYFYYDLTLWIFPTYGDDLNLWPKDQYGIKNFWRNNGAAPTMNSSPASNFASISFPISFSGTRRSSLMSPLSLIKDM